MGNLVQSSDIHNAKVKCLFIKIFFLFHYRWSINNFCKRNIEDVFNKPVK